ncbi:hypothetical protein ACQEVF_43255 [Nonomuraea polychroma]|uniref:hypothetical protein n=1 Tax=Nonomuraea polychroma TaxID=46176 RepID=UPI003D8D5EC8
MARSARKRSATAARVAATARRAAAQRRQAGLPPAKRGPRRSTTWGLTPGEFAALPAEQRAELHNATRAQRHQAVLTTLQIITSLGVVVGLIFTGLGLTQTAKSLDAAREEQRIAREGLDLARKGQAHDRFTKAIEQLANGRDLCPGEDDQGRTRLSLDDHGCACRLHPGARPGYEDQP